MSWPPSRPEVPGAPYFACSPTSDAVPCQRAAAAHDLANHKPGVQLCCKAHILRHLCMVGKWGRDIVSKIGTAQCGQIGFWVSPASGLAGHLPGIRIQRLGEQPDMDAGVPPVQCRGNNPIKSASLPRAPEGRGTASADRAAPPPPPPCAQCQKVSCSSQPRGQRVIHVMPQVAAANQNGNTMATCPCCAAVAAG